MREGAATLWEAIWIHGGMLETTENVNSIKTIGVGFISIIRTEPADFAAMKTEIYERYIIRLGIFFSAGKCSCIIFCLWCICKYLFLNA